MQTSKRSLKSNNVTELSSVVAGESLMNFREGFYNKPVSINCNTGQNAHTEVTSSSPPSTLFAIANNASTNVKDSCVF